VGSVPDPRPLVQFPQFSKVPQKVVIECQDCIIQGIDLVDFHILVDQNKQRV
jgi:hypothetical protein